MLPCFCADRAGSVLRHLLWEDAGAEAPRHPHPPNRTQERKRIIYRGDGMPIEQPKTRYDREIRMC